MEAIEGRIQYVFIRTQDTDELIKVKIGWTLFFDDFNRYDLIVPVKRTVWSKTGTVVRYNERHKTFSIACPDTLATDRLNRPILDAHGNPTWVTRPGSPDARFVATACESWNANTVMSFN